MTPPLLAQRARRAVALLCALLLFTSACSSDTAPGPTSNAAPAAEAQSPGTDQPDSADDATDDSSDDASSNPEDPVVADGETASHADQVTALTALLPATTRGLFAADLTSLQTDGSAAKIAQGEGADPALNEVFGSIAELTKSIDVADALSSVVLATSTDPSEGHLLLASVREAATEEIAGQLQQIDGTEEHMIALTPSSVLVAGTQAAVESVINVADGNAPFAASELAPFANALSTAIDDRNAPLGFAYGLDALYAQPATAEPSRLDLLANAAAFTGTIELTGDSMLGAIEFHTPRAADFVDTYNTLNRPATQAAIATERELTLGEPVVDDLSRVIVDLPAQPLDATAEEVRTSRNLFRKLFVGMHAHDYAAGVADQTNDAWLDFVVLSERDDVEPRSPGSVYIRWEFRDEAAIEAFEQNELPAGFKLAPTRFVESDAPEGEIFFALNLYNAGGGSIVEGARAEWDVFVHGPDGADPNASVRPRFMVVEALAEELSADSVNLLTSAEPLSHLRIGNDVVSTVSRFEDGVEIPVFESAFPIPRPGEAEVARFTREMAIGNDYIYWGHGVSDRVFYNATTFNHDAHFVDISQMTFTDQSHWAQYLAPEVKDAVYYQNSLQYVASPMANLDSAYLDITEEWLDELIGFTTNGHQHGLMNSAVAGLFRGQADPFVGVLLTNETPATYYHFEVTDPAGLEAMLGLPTGKSLAPIALRVGDESKHYLTLSIYEIDGATEGQRAEWSVYTDDGSGRPPHLTIIELMTEATALDPVAVISPPSEVEHVLADGIVSTRLGSSTTAFEASFDTSETTDAPLSLDWIEAGDTPCSLNNICDSLYYDAETLDVPGRQPADITVAEFTSPWSDFVSDQPSLAFFRDNAQHYAVKRWHNLDVELDPVPFVGLDNPTHTIEGEGMLRGRDTDVVDSEYRYTGDAILDGDVVTFAIDQQIENQLGLANIFTTGSFDLVSASGTQTVVDCAGPALMCSGIDIGSTGFYSAQDLQADDPDAISWTVDAAVNLGGSFGTADSSSTFRASTG